MERLYTWSGRSFGYRLGEYLWTYTGKNVGKFYADDVYGSNGRYLGELRGGKLITRLSKKSRRKSSFMPRMNRMARMKTLNRLGSLLPSGYEDFPEFDGC